MQKKEIRRIFLILLLYLLSNIINASGNSSQPNIVFIIADDLGWNDVSFHGSDQIMTPNIDLLAYSGVALHRYYTHCQCTPSRSAILTGKYAHRLGMQGYPLTNAEDRGMPLNEKILPQYLQELGYSTHLVGKWHVGHSRFAFLPTFRGYDTHYGHRGGFVDSYEYVSEETWVTGKVSGFDLYRNVTADWGAQGFITDIYNDEARSIIENHDTAKPLFLTVAHSAPHSGNEGALLQAASEDVRAMRHIESPQRRIFSAMVKKLDDSVGDIVTALKLKGILNNTVIVFVSDNGAPTEGISINYGSNSPLRGQKMTPWEGGVRAIGLIWMSKLTSENHIWKGYFHAADWLPTLLGAIDVAIPKDLNGINHWNNLINNRNSDRDTIYEIDDYTNYSSLIFQHHKLVVGNVNKDISNHSGKDLQGIIGKTPSYIEAIKSSKIYSVLQTGSESIDDKLLVRNNLTVDCNGKEFNGCFPDKGNWCLYDILADPCEKEDLSEALPDVVEALMFRLQKEIQNVIPRTVPLFRDPRGSPKLFNYTWTSFMDLTDNVS